MPVVNFVRAQLGTDTFCLAALVCLSTAVTPTVGGFYTDNGLTWMVLAITLLFAAVFAPRRHTSSVIWALAVGAVGLGTRIYSVDAAWAVAAFAAAAVLAAPRRWAWMLVAGAGSAALLPLGRAWTWGTVDIDVFGFVEGAGNAILHGQNPYTPTFPLLLYVDPSTISGATAHFLYGPVVALLAAPGAFVGDVRVVSFALFVVLFAGIINLAGTDPDERRQWWLVAFCAAFPLTITMVVHSWVDIYSVALFVVWAALRRRHGAWATLALGASFAAKFTIIPALIPFWVWSSKARREGAFAILVAAAITLPFAIATGIGDFMQDVVWIYTNFPTRFDGLTANAYLYHQGQGPLEGWVGVLAVVVLACLILWRKPRDLGDLFVSSALLMTVSFFFAQQAFVNYYFIPITLLLLALASRGLPLDTTENIHLPLMVGRIGRRTLGLAGRQWARAK